MGLELLIEFSCPEAFRKQSRLRLFPKGEGGLKGLYDRYAFITTRVAMELANDENGTDSRGEALKDFKSELLF